MRNKTKQIMLILIACVAIAGLMLSCSSLNESGVKLRTGAEKAMPAAFQLSGLSIDPAKVTTGEGVWITAEVTNTGETDGIYEAELRIDNVSAVSNKVAVPAGGTQNLTFSVSWDTPGTYEVTLGELAGEFVVAERAATQSSNAVSVGSQSTFSGCCGSSSSGSSGSCSSCSGATPPSSPPPPPQRRTGCGCGGG